MDLFSPEWLNRVNERVESLTSNGRQGTDLIQLRVQLSSDGPSDVKLLIEQTRPVSTGSSRALDEALLVIRHHEALSIASGNMSIVEALGRGAIKIRGNFTSLIDVGALISEEQG